MRFAIVGTSGIAERFVDAVSKCEGNETVAVYSRTKENAERFARAFGIPLKYTSLTDLSESSALDAVYIASPNSCHFEQSILAMRGGKHVLCEKPIATSVGEFSRMLCAAEENGVVLLEAQKHLFSPGIDTIYNLLPEIGPIRRASFVFHNYSPSYERLKMGETPNVFRKELCGGALMDIGVYCVALMAALFGEPDTVVSLSNPLSTGVDGQGAAIARYDGFLVELIYSKLCHSVTPSAIQGEEGSLVFEKLSRIENIDIIRRNGEKRRVNCCSGENQMIYEIKAFNEMVKIPQKAKQFHRISMITQSIMDTIRG